LRDDDGLPLLAFCILVFFPSPTWQNNKNEEAAMLLEETGKSLMQVRRTQGRYFWSRQAMQRDKLECFARLYYPVSDSARIA
jgi:hypothetical protein